MTKQFLLIEDTGYAFLVNHEGDDTLRTLQTGVDGLIECVTADDGVLGFRADIWVNEEGLFRQDFAINLVASFITGRQIVGPAVIARSSSQGATLGLTDAQIQRLRRDGLIVDDNDGKGWTINEAVAWRADESVTA